MSRNIDKRVECPYYVEPPSNGRSKSFEALSKVRERKRVRCEGLTPGGRLMIEFATTNEREDFCEDFCCSECWRGCPIAIMLEDLKYNGG